jgi:hypothetical protein
MKVYDAVANKSQRVSPAAKSLLPADDLPSKDSSLGACYSRSLGINPDISQKYKMGDIQSAKDTLECAKNNIVIIFDINERVKNLRHRYFALSSSSSF